MSLRVAIRRHLFVTILAMLSRHVMIARIPFGICQEDSELFSDHHGECSFEIDCLLGLQRLLQEPERLVTC